jgi:hypothetical protein
MYVIFEYLTIVALVALVTSVVLAGSLVLLALEQGINRVRRIARKSAEPAMDSALRAL